jgi:hypothetical protein
LGDVADSVVVGLSGVTATGQIGDEADEISVPVSSVVAVGEVGQVQPAASLGITGVEATVSLGDLTASVQPVIIVGTDSHEGDKKRSKKWKDEQEARERRKRELIEVYEELVEGRPTVAAALVKPYIEQKARRTAEPTIDWNRLLTDLERVEAIYREHREMDDEDVLLLL